MEQSRAVATVVVLAASPSLACPPSHAALSTSSAHARTLPSFVFPPYRRVLSPAIIRSPHEASCVPLYLAQSLYLTGFSPSENVLCTQLGQRSPLKLRLTASLIIFPELAEPP